MRKSHSYVFEMVNFSIAAMSLMLNGTKGCLLQLMSVHTYLHFEALNW